MEFESREYGPDSGEDVREAICARASIIDTRIILYRELPVMSEWQATVFGDHVKKMAEQWDAWTLIVDLTETKPPRAPARRKIKEVLTDLKPGLREVVLYTGSNKLVVYAAKFILAVLRPVGGMQFVATEAEAIEAARAARARAAALDPRPPR